MMKNLFHPVQVLYISGRGDATYFDTNRWKQLISTSLPYLRLFDIDISTNDDSYYGINICEYLDEFSSSFWTERQWFFQYASYEDRYDIDHFLYSINPYRRKHFTLHNESYENINTNGQKYNMDSVDRVNIYDAYTLIGWKYCFPNVTSLRASGSCFSEEICSTHLNRIIPLKKLTTLDTTCSEHSFSDLIEILQRVPNIHTLSIGFDRIYDRDSVLFEENESFQLASKTNKITKMKIVSYTTLETTKFLVMLCPRLEHLTIASRYESLAPVSSEDTLKTLLQFLLSKDNNNTRYLSSLRIDNISYDQIETVKTFIESEELHDISFIKVEKPSGRTMIYLWW